ncbi:MAG TPA: choice-of-anchor tandem repeat GloVer-containing protein [Bryobacteraceae bacterium]|nr:choice-of-anchor tandem repeat GloVer-containing protein [Bryobacteraceae bacterium]
MRNGTQQTILGVRLRATLTSPWPRSIGLLCLIFSAAIASPAQEEQPATNAVGFQTLVNFDGNSGYYPGLNLVQGFDGSLYGTTEGTAGTVFKITPSGTLTTIYNFCFGFPTCTSGANPSQSGALALDTNGNFYGATGNGGSAGGGTIFKVTPSGTLTTLYNVCSSPNRIDGCINTSGVVRGQDGNFYGVMAGGGANDAPLCSLNGPGCGTVFKITPAGTLTTIYNFCSQANCADGAIPYAALVSGRDGSLYGIASAGGAYGVGTVFKITPGGKLTTLHSFDFTDGAFANVGAPMIQATNGNFYGTTYYGGTNGFPPSNFFSAGTVFEITPAGEFQTLYNFCSQSNCADGGAPLGLVQGSDGNFYGAASLGGLYGFGTLFKITPAGVLTPLHSFGNTDGAFPEGLIQATNGKFYGETQSGGTNGDGTVFSLSAGLRPFVETLPTLGKVGELIKILGTNLTGVTGVSFNGTPAAFRVVSGSLILAAVPTGATSGFVTVTTSTSTLKSAVKFIVLP